MDKVAILSEDQELISEAKEILSPLELITISDTRRLEGIDTILLDIDSVGTGHLDTLKKKVFVIVITAEKGARHLLESMTFGAFDCVLRPVASSGMSES